MKCLHQNHKRYYRRSSYSDGKSVNDIYSFHPDVPPGYKIIEKPIPLDILPIVVNKISRIETKIVRSKRKFNRL